MVGRESDGHTKDGVNRKERDDELETERESVLFAFGFCGLFGLSLFSGNVGIP
jgi:hypothetical protein